MTISQNQFPCLIFCKPVDIFTRRINLIEFDGVLTYIINDTIIVFEALHITYVISEL